MSELFANRAILIAFALAGIPSLASAQGPAPVEGTYCLRGVHEVGSCVRLSPDARFDYFLAYGAFDERSEGKWKADGADVVLDSAPYDKAPTFAFKGFEPLEGEGFDIAVVNKAGARINGIDVRAACDGRTAEVGMTGAGGYHVACVSPPTEVSLGLRMFGVPYQTLAVGPPTGADRTYVFAFDPGDLGSKRFAATRLKREGADSLVMTYANPAIAELDGKSFRYEREQEQPDAR